MSKRCPKCRETWSDFVQTCPLDGEVLEQTFSEHPVADPPPVQINPHVGFSLQIGDRLGRYKLTGLLAKGSAATVFKGEHETLGREVAIKVLHGDLSRHPDVVARFFGEARAVNRIGHPNIVEITDFVEGGDRPPYMVMELLKGQDLRDYLLSHGPLPTKEAVAIAVRICGALHAAHALGIVHRDLKAENVFLTPRESGPPEVKLLDFGIAKWLTRSEQLPETLTGEVVGTPEYMSPEQVRGDPLDARTDVYALGVLLYEMITDELPFDADLVSDLLSKQMNEEPKQPSVWLEEKKRSPLPRVLEDAILKCLAKRPKDRFQTMEELKLTLEMSLDDTEVVALPVPSGSKKRARRLVAGAAAGLALAAAGGIVLYRNLSHRERATTDSRPAPRRKAAPADVRTGPASTQPLTITSEPPRATVFRLSDGKFLGLTPLRLDRPPASPEHFLIRLAGHSQTTLSIGPEARGPVRVVLQKLPAAAPAAEDPLARPGTDGTGSLEPRAESEKTRRRGRRPGKKTKAGDAKPLKDEWGIADPFKKK